MARCKQLNEPDCRFLRKITQEGEKVGIRPAELYCFYCTAAPSGGKKIGHMATWSGSTPKWCPEGRDEQ